MDRNRTRGVVLAILAVVAAGLVATAAAPLFEQQPGGGGPGFEQPSGNATTEDPDRVSDIPLDVIMFGVFALVVIAIVVQFAADPWGSLKAVLLAAALGGAILGLVYAALTYLSSSTVEPREPGEPNFSRVGEPTPNGSLGSGEGTADPLVLPGESVVAVVLVVGVLGAATLLAWRTGRIQSALGLDGGDDDREADLDALGRVAGKAAEDVEAASTPAAADNAIYRAWSEMVALLDAPDPQSGTPRQFAAAAVEAGMDPEDVGVLTRTFEEVRYGDAALSAERRERATEALRRIEAAHADREDDSAAGDHEAADGQPRDFRNPGEER